MRGVVLALVLAGCAAPSLDGLVAPRPSNDELLSVMPYLSAAASCSAVAIEPTLLATAGHCVRAVGAGVVLDGTRPLNVINTWAGPSDSGLIKVDGALRHHASVGQLPTPGDVAILAGYGCDSAPPAVYRLGVRGAVYLARTSDKLLAYESSACHGDSGGAVFDAAGQLVAIMVTVNTDSGPVTEVDATPIAFVLDGLIESEQW